MITAIAASGGGVKGIIEAGMVQGILDYDPDFDPKYLAGVSTGSLLASFLAQAPWPGRGHFQQRLDQLVQFYYQLKDKKDIYKWTMRWQWLSYARLAMGGQSIYNPAPLMAKIRKNISPQKLLDSGRQMFIGVVDIDQADYIEVTNTVNQVHDWILASCSMPLFFPPVQLPGVRGLDGGIINMTPFNFLKKATDIDRLYVVMASPLNLPPVAGTYSGLGLAKRALGIHSNEVYKTDLVQVNEAFGGDLVVIAPTEQIMDTLEVNPDKIRAGFNHGYKVAEDILKGVL